MNKKPHIVQDENGTKYEVYGYQTTKYWAWKLNKDGTRDKRSANGGSTLRKDSVTVIEYK